MPHSFIKIWIHAVWATKERQPMIHKSVENNIYQFISEELRALGCPVRIINGMPDHIHCLFLLSRQKSIAEVIKQIKGSNSHFINQANLISEKFSWQTGYAAFSVSESIVDRVFTTLKTKNNITQRKNFSRNMKNLLNCMV